jgi:two-component system, OmpR family, sensor histidine kinase KdpD
VALATGAGAIGRAHLAAPDFVMPYLLVIGLAAARLGRGPSLLASALSVLAYDFFFVPPFYTFAVSEERSLLTFAMMFVVGLLISGLTLRIREQEREARAREERTAALYALSRDLASALDEEQAAAVSSRHAARTFGTGAAVFLPDGNGALALAAKDGPEVRLDAGGMEAACRTLAQDRSSWFGALCFVPLGTGVQTLGVLALSSGGVQPGGEPPGGQFLEAFARQAALALERARLAETAKVATLRARTEEMRSSLLSAVSHDLRTPLGAITGAATTLRDGGVALDPSQRTELVDTVCEEAERLERLVRNLLDMTRLESNTLEVKREWVPLEEIVGSALARVETQLADRPIRTRLAPDLPLVSIDPLLFEQVLVNLLENAAKYTPSGSPVEISAHAGDGALVVELADRGPGVPPGSEARLFEKFFRKTAAGAPGFGLGLAICRGICQAHGGTLVAENRTGGGALFRVTLPLVDAPPPLPADLEPQGSP